MADLAELSNVITEIKSHSTNLTAGVNSLVSIGEVAVPIVTAINPAVGASMGAGLLILKEVASLLNRLTGYNTPVEAKTVGIGTGDGTT